MYIAFVVFCLGYTVVETRIEEQFGTQIFVHSEIDGVFPFHFKVFVVVERVVSPRPAYGITEFYVSVYGDGGAEGALVVFSLVDAEASDDS